MQRLFNRATKILLSTDTVVLVAIAMLGPFYTMFVEKIGGHLYDASLTIAVFAFSAGLTTIFVGKYTDKVKESELLVVAGYVLMGIGFVLYNFVDSLALLFVVQVLVGIAGAIYTPASEALHVKHFKNCRAGKIWGTEKAVSYFAAAAGAIIGSLVIVEFGFNTLFIAMAVFCFASATYIYFLPRKVL
ncbi:MFS transporter [Patescibacteria group bacterium]|nr:MFS transporter [Patescibacteria group bacterium]